jgi:PleD family two-component response regulator
VARGQVVETMTDAVLVSDPAGRLLDLSPLGLISVIRDVSEAQSRLAVIEKFKAELAEEAVRDHLTGLYNRRHLDRLLASTLAEAGSGQPVGVVLLDADHFKRVNDGHGHAAGDQVLRGLAGVLRAATRPGDTIARVETTVSSALQPTAR